MSNELMIRKMTAKREPMTKSEKVKLAILLAVLIVLIGFLGPVSSVSVAFVDALARMPTANRTVATLLAIVGVSLSYWSLMKWRQNAVRQALKSYIFAAVGMAGIYYLINVSHAGCYSFGTNVQPSSSVLDFVYFSFVTVTSLGYGDIVPNHAFVRMLVVMQILFGVFLILKATKDGKDRQCQ